eukprot:COSAG06_NODE_296_length_18097_cov_302.227081_3_plen_67_part_00
MVADLRDLRAADTISVVDLMWLIGVLMFATVVFSLCRPYLRQMMSLLRTADTTLIASKFQARAHRL